MALQEDSESCAGFVVCKEEHARLPAGGRCDAAVQVPPRTKEAERLKYSTCILGPVLHLRCVCHLDEHISASARVSVPCRLGSSKRESLGAHIPAVRLAPLLASRVGCLRGCRPGRQVSGFTIEEQIGAVDGPMLLRGLMRALLVHARVQGGLVLEIPALTVPCMKGAAYHSN